MLSNISYFLVSVFFCYALLHIFSSFFITHMQPKFKMYQTNKRYMFLNFIFVCLWVFVAISLTQKNIIESNLDIDRRYNVFIDFFLNKFTIFQTSGSIFLYLCLICSLIYLHTLSIIDCIFKYVPNILLFLLFVFSCIVYYIASNFYDGYPFLSIGIAYVFHFALHLFGDKEKLGQADIWVIACLAILLESFFNGFYYYIFEVLVLASLIGILFNLIKLKKEIKKYNSVKNELNNTCYNKQLEHAKDMQLPFIPFLAFSFMCVSMFHAA